MSICFQARLASIAKMAVERSLLTDFSYVRNTNWIICFQLKLLKESPMAVAPKSVELKLRAPGLGNAVQQLESPAHIWRDSRSMTLE